MMETRIKNVIDCHIDKILVLNFILYGSYYLTIMVMKLYPWRIKGLFLKQELIS